MPDEGGTNQKVTNQEVAHDEYKHTGAHTTDVTYTTTGRSGVRQDRGEAAEVTITTLRSKTEPNDTLERHR